MININYRNGIKSIFGKIKNHMSSSWREIGTFTSRFTGFGSNIYRNELVVSCIRALSEHTSKANVRVIRHNSDNTIFYDKRLEKMIQYRPNLYMSGKEFLNKIRNLFEIYNTVFIYIMRDDFGKCIGLYPMPNASWEAINYMDELYIKFNYPNGITMTHPWKDLAVLRKDYIDSDIFGGDNSAILNSLDLLNTINQGIDNAIKSTSNLRGLLKFTKMLKPEDIKDQKDQFVKDYLNINNSSGIGGLDSGMEFTQIELKPQLAGFKSAEEVRNTIYRYFGVNEEILLSQTIGDKWDAFYEAKIEPFLIALSLELSYKIFSDRELDFGDEIIFESNRMQYASMKDKLSLVQMVDRKALTPNEWRAVMNLAPVPWGDEPQSWQNPKNENLNNDTGGGE